MSHRLLEEMGGDSLPLRIRVELVEHHDRIYGTVSIGHTDNTIGSLSKDAGLVLT